MPRLRHLLVSDFTAGADDGARGVVAAAAEHFQLSLATSGLAGPASTILVALHPHDDSLAESITVLVQCDKPAGQEIITAQVPEGWSGSRAGAGRVVVDVLRAGLTRLGVARGWDSATLLSALGSAQAAAIDEIGAAPERWAVVAEGRGTSAPEQPHEIKIVGGGPTNGVPKAYQDELDRLLEQLAGDTWAQWWSGSSVKLAEIWYWFDGARPGVRVRVGASVSASIERPVATIDAVDPTRQARDDVTSLVERIAQRLKLPAPPELV
jgi:hypothetical protein